MRHMSIGATHPDARGVVLELCGGSWGEHHPTSRADTDSTMRERLSSLTCGRLGVEGELTHTDKYLKSHSTIVLVFLRERKF